MYPLEASRRRGIIGKGYAVMVVYKLCMRVPGFAVELSALEVHL